MQCINWLTFRFEFPKTGKCFYCGEPAQARDHVIPFSFLQPDCGHLFDVGIFAETCMACNSMLGALFFDSLDRRCRHLNERLAIREKKTLALPDWTNIELLNLKKSLRSKVQEDQQRKRIAKRRIEWQSTNEFFTTWELTYEKAADQFRSKELREFLRYPWTRTLPPLLSADAASASLVNLAKKNARDVRFT